MVGEWLPRLHVAAGMFNPVSFRRIVEVWNAEAHLKAMRDTMASIEEALGLEGQLLHNAGGEGVRQRNVPCGLGRTLGPKHGVASGHLEEDLTDGHRWD